MFPCFSPQSVGQLSNMIRIRLNNCIVSKENLHGVDNLQKLVSVGGYTRFIFIFNSIAVIITVNSIIVFIKQPSSEIFLANFFGQYFSELLENFSIASAKESKLSKAVDIKTLRHN